MSERLFADRRDAGRVLAARLRHYRNRPDVVVSGLPRGGVPVAYEVADALGAPLDVFLVRKLGVPDREELAMGAIASGGVVVVNEDVVRGLHIRPEVIQEAAAREGRELARREQAYREGRPEPQVTGRTVILVDDGLAPGASMRAAIQATTAGWWASAHTPEPSPPPTSGAARRSASGSGRRCPTAWKTRVRPTSSTY